MLATCDYHEQATALDIRWDGSAPEYSQARVQ